MTDEDKKAWNIALSAAATAASLAQGNPDEPLPGDTMPTLRALTTDELIILRGRLMQDAGKRYGAGNVTNPLTFVTALKLDGVRGLKRVDKGRTSDEQSAIIKRIIDEIAGRIPERTFLQKLFGAR
jgi:hypothetical protein